MRFYFVLLVVILLFSAKGNEEKQQYPSKYIGIFSLIDGKRNGQLNPSASNYTGNYNNPRLRMAGYYKNGVPDSTWISYYPYKTPHFVTNYYEGHFNFMAYYPDGFPAISMSGTYDVLPDAFVEKPQKVLRWDPAGNLISLPLKRNTFGQWIWSENDRSVPSKDRVALGDINVKVISELIGNQKVLIAIYFYTSLYFCQKDLFVGEIAQKTGELVITPLEKNSNQIQLYVKNEKMASNRITAIVSFTPSSKSISQVPPMSFVIEK